MTIWQRLDIIAPVIDESKIKNGINYWKGKWIIPLEDWIRIKNIRFRFKDDLDCAHAPDPATIALQYFPDDFDRTYTFIPENELEQKDEDTKRWYSEYIELMEFRKNANYGRLKCFHCLLNPALDEPIFMGINRLVSKGLTPAPEYPCRVVDRFRCPYETCKNDDKQQEQQVQQQFDVNDLFRLKKMAFAVEISLAKALHYDDSKVRITNKEELFHALTNKETFARILEQGGEVLLQDAQEYEYLKEYIGQDKEYMVNYFMKIKDNVNLEELRGGFY